MSHRYAFCGEVVESTMPLPELLPVSPESSDTAIAWRCDPGHVPAAAACVPVHESRDADGRRWLELSRADRAYRLAFSVGVRFIVEGRNIRWETDRGVPAHTIRHLLLDHVLPIALSGGAGTAMFHSAAVAMRGAAVLFVGTSGSGKSTLAGWCAAHGDEVLADDCVRVHERDGMWMAQAAYPGLRVWPDAASLLHRTAAIEGSVAHYTPKVRLSVQAASQSVLPIRRVYLLRAGSSVTSLVQRPTARTIVDLTRNLFNLDITQRATLADDFDRAARLIEGDLVRYLGVPGSFADLGSVRSAVVADLRIATATEGCA